MEYKYVEQKWLMFKEVKAFKFPLSVRSTAIRIFDNIIRNIGSFKLSNQELAILSILVACKCEDFQGSPIDNILRRLELERRMGLIEMESVVLNITEFNFYYPSPYTKAYAILIMLQERDIVNVYEREEIPEDLLTYEDGKIIIKDIDRLWERTILNLDYILCIEREDWSELEMSYAALEFPLGIFSNLTFKFSKEITERLIKKLAEVKNIIQNKYD
ncbi:hypothetical protein NBO_24g0012 [Nosema bombycis CQ1]|uniref:Cyclin N-terminal domain-containing protein n=1 Tax=Nosema bombycis (strain CQ1 / CVCC 102059) TaxID=578461 RepID=R0KUM9_NOSB1|nr:hypothetical protein NBO_24g0012 [Nosema bombycis CQ1]|eukprot:EOB14566.1 hypothetical protein NBO_24g0012 [Nosema bombycis CQ1]